MDIIKDPCHEHHRIFSFKDVIEDSSYEHHHRSFLRTSLKILLMHIITSPKILLMNIIKDPSHEHHYRSSL
eukprot:6118342-Karenia_brevis.AAC.1